MRAAWPDLVVVADDGWRDLRRVPSPLFSTGTRCMALCGDGSGDKPFMCSVYEARPSACRELEPGSDSCILARQRVGLQPWNEGQTPDGPLHR